MTDHIKLLERIAEWQKAPRPNWSSVERALKEAQSMRDTLIDLTNAPPIGAHVRLTRRVWLENPWRIYLDTGNTGVVHRLSWDGRPEIGYWRVHYQPDCEWRWDERGKYAFVHKAPGVIHSAMATNVFEVISPEEALPYPCACPKCGWAGKAADTKTDMYNYAICPECGNEGQHRGYKKDDYLLPLVGERWPGMADEMVRQ